MIYTIAFISNQQLRDIKLEKILNPDFIMDNYIHEGKYDYLVKLRGRYSSDIIWNCRSYNVYALKSCSKWKTERTAKRYLEQFKKSIAEKSKRTSFRGGSGFKTEAEFWASDYTPVVCDLTEDHNNEIKRQMDDEKRRHDKKMLTLTKKLS